MIKMRDESNKILQQFKSDCSKCSGLCCTALVFSKTDGFPKDKIAGKPCINLQKDYRCKIHKELERDNMKGCIGYDCFGAGQHVTQSIYHGQTWQDIQNQKEEIFDVFVIVFQLYQIRYFLAEAITMIPTEVLKNDIQNLITENETMCNYSPENILLIDVEKYRNKINLLLKEVCSMFMESLPYDNKKRPSEFFGKNFKNRDMSGFDLSTKLLIAANFDGCVFKHTIFLGADTRDTNFSNADLREAVFLSQGQVNSAKGNRDTKLPKHLDYPATWR